MAMIEDLNSLSVALAVSSLAFLGRIPTVLPARTDFDFYGHQYFGFLGRGRNLSVFGPLNLNVVNSRPLFGPFLWALLSTRINYEWLKKYQHLLNPALEGVFFGTTFLMFVDLGFSKIDSLTVLLLIYFSPVTFSSISNGPRLASFTPRLGSEGLAWVFFLAELNRLEENSLTWLVVMILVASLVFMSSKFGIQALTFISAFYGGLSGSWFPLLAVLIAGGILLAVYQRSFLGSLLNQVSHLREIQHRAARRAFPQSESASFAYVLRGKLSIETLANFFRHNPLAYLVVLTPVVVYTAPWFLIDPKGADSITVATHWLMLASVLVFLLTSTRWGRFLGHPERYLSHSLPLFGAGLIGGPLPHAQLFSILVVLHGLVLYALEIVARKQRKKIMTEAQVGEAAAIIEILKRTNEKATVACLPYHAGPGTWNVLMETNHRVVFDLVNPRVGGPQKNFLGTYPYLRASQLEQMSDTYAVGYLISTPSEVQKLRTNQNLSPRWKNLTPNHSSYILLSRT